jgi:small conductance mechanosensitive channel
LRRRLIDGTSNASVYLDLAKTQAAGLRSSAAMLPDDKEVLARLQLADIRVSRIASSIEANLLIMTDLGIPTAQYKQQLLTVTGEITTSVFEWEVIVGLLTSWGQSIVDFVVQKGPSFLVQILIFFLIIYVFIKIGGFVQKVIRAGFQRSHNSFSVLLQTMVLSISRNIIVILGVLIALSQVGISLGPLLTGLGIVGFIVGFALQDSLSNFASGMMILFYRPFDVGDTIDAGGARGKVSSMSLVNTTIRTFDNQSLIIPNNKIWQDVITNVTDQRQRRVDMVFGIAYDEDIDKVEKLLLDVVSADERVLDDPAPMIKVGAFSDSSVDILCRPWVNTADYWDVLWDMNKKVKQAFDREGIAIPFPQRDVHVFNEQASVKSKSGSSFDTPDVPEGNEPASPEDDQQ